MEVKPLTIELTTGFETSDGERHKSITFGKVVTGEVLFRLDESPQSSIYTQREFLAVGYAMTAFGSLLMPPVLEAFLKLDEFDIADIMNAYDAFNSQFVSERTPEFISDSEVMLSIGFEKDGIMYPSVKFGKHITGRDMVQADINGYQGLKRECFLIGRQIASISTQDGSSTIQGAIGIDLFDTLLAGDIFALRVASERWRGSFRRQRAGVQESVGAQRVDSSEGDRVE